MNWTFYPINEFAEYQEQWDRLNQNFSESPLLHTDFVIPLLEYFATGDELLAIYGDIRSPKAMAVLCKAKFGAWRTFQPSQAPVGTWLQNPSDSVEPLLKSLHTSLPGFKLNLSITQQDPLILPPPDQSANLATLDYIDSARISVAGSFEDYWSQRGKNLRQNLRRQRNRFKRENITPRLEIVSEPEKIAEAVQVYGNLESAGWKQATNTAVDIGNAQGKFYASMIRNFSERGQGLVFQYYFNDSLVATDLCIQGGGSLVILKTTYDEEINTSSPAMLMREEAFRYIFDQTSVQKIEFYGKVMDWHIKWSNEIRTLFHINYWSTTAKVLLRR
jgi:CelD/BcsL family acetyltransferase involved in cellulose biosynthesis